MAIVQVDYLASIENGQNQLSEDTSDQNIEPINSIQNVEEFRSMESEERQENKRRRTLMNDKQIQTIEKALLNHPVMKKSDGTLQRWAAELSRHGSKITADQLKNWLSNRKGKLARAAAKFKVGQHVILTDDKGQEVGKGTIHLVKGVWSGKNLVESSSYVVDVKELKKSAAQSVSCDIRMLWNSSQLVLIQQQLP
ncbi:putative nodulin homeobox protein [Helianthus anomalus]